MKALTLSALLVAATLFAVPATAVAQSSQPGVTVPVTGSGSGLSLTGSLEIVKFVRAGDGIAAIGTVTGQVTDAAGRTTSFVRNVSTPVTIGQATCDILHLDLGPLSLDILGLQVDLSQVVLDITAVAGSGNLLGNLLCAVAGLLDGAGALVQIINLLNQILALL